MERGRDRVGVRAQIREKGEGCNNKSDQTIPNGGEKNRETLRNGHEKSVMQRARRRKKKAREDGVRRGRGEVL